MSTRCLTQVYEDGEVLLSMFRHHDGYPEGHGKDLSEFCDGFKIVDGISGRDSGKIANGMGCFSAQLIAHFKARFPVGGIYIYASSTRPEDTDCEYLYKIRPSGEALTVETSRI